MADAGDVDALQAGGHRVVAVELLVAQPEHRRMVETAAGQFDLQATTAVQHHLVRPVLHAPRREQPRQIRGVSGQAADAGGERRGVELGIRVDEHDQVAAAQHVLVNRVLRGRRQLLRMDQQQHLQAIVHVLQAGRIKRLQLEQLAQLLHHRPRLLPQRQVALHRQRAEHADRRLAHLVQLVQQLGDVVFEEGLARGVEERDRERFFGHAGIF